MVDRLRNRHLLASDVALLSMASYASFVLRLDQYDLGQYWLGFLAFTAAMLLSTILLFVLTGLYSRYWRYASVEELTLLCLTSALSTFVAATLVLTPYWLGDDEVAMPRAVPIIFMLLALAVTAGPRYTLRLMAHYAQRRNYNDGDIPTIIAGAGDAGAMIVRELQHHSQLRVQLVGFVDDDKHKQGNRIHGVPVLGGTVNIPELVRRLGVQQVIIALPGAPGKAIRTILDLCESAGVKTQIVPAIYQLLDGKVSVSQLREVQIEDLLRREPIQTDIAAVRTLIRGRRVLITGGGGSIGSELCRQIIRCHPAELVILGHGENSVFEIHGELERYLAASGDDRPPVKLMPVIADIRFPERIQSVFVRYAPEMVFHAAAHKHVPLMEHNPAEAITTNVLGTRNVLRAAMTAGVEHFVMISSDKAVNPTSVMGASKRVAELLVHQAARQSGRPYMAVRFGNVLGSRGSVAITFKRQIASGGPITITHPEMRRFFMTIPEAVQLVLQASVLGKGGEVFMLDMGKPVKIVDLARDMIELSGLEVGRDIDIVFTKMRPGEKLYEELFVLGEAYRPTVHYKVFIAQNDSTFVPPHLDQWIEALAIAAERDDTAAIVWVLRNLIPQHQLSHQVDMAGVEDDRYTASPLLEQAVGVR